MRLYVMLPSKGPITLREVVIYTGEQSVMGCVPQLSSVYTKAFPKSSSLVDDYSCLMNGLRCSSVLVGRFRLAL